RLAGGCAAVQRRHAHRVPCHRQRGRTRPGDHRPRRAHRPGRRYGHLRRRRGGVPVSERIEQVGELPLALAQWLLTFTLAHGLTLAIAAPVVLSLFIGLRHLATAARQWSWRRHARLVEILPPPHSDLSGAEDLWRQLLGTLRPWWKRLLLGQPHLVWEQEMSQRGLRIRMWVPSPVPPGMVERAVASAWPGASVTTNPVPELRSEVRTHAATVRLARPDHYPIET